MPKNYIYVGRNRFNQLIFMVFKKYPAENLCIKQKNIRRLTQTILSFKYMKNNNYLGSGLVV